MNKVPIEDYMLTTFDNPFNPFDQFDVWWKTDLLLGHDCCGLLAREANTSSVFSDEINDWLIKVAMDRIISREPLLYKKVKKSDYDSVETMPAMAESV